MSTIQRWVIADDTSTDIQYVQGDWFEDSSGSQDAIGNFGPVFQGTLHGVKTGPASLVYQFTGSQVNVSGSNNVQNNSGILNPSWQCFVDNVKLESTPFQFPENNWQFCSSPKLPDGNHVLTVNVSVASPQTFWIDQIQYMPTSELQLTNATVLVNSPDPLLKSAFGNGWALLDGGAHMTTIKGSTFTLNFTGVSLSWFGFTPQELPRGSTTGAYSVDENAPISFLLNGLSSSPDASTVYNQKFFQTPMLSPGNHQIVVTYNGEDGQTTPLTLDYLVIQNASVPILPNSSPTPTPWVGGTSGSGGSGGGGGGSKSNVKAIAGGVVGGVVFIALAALGLLFIRRRYGSSTTGVSTKNAEGGNGDSTTPRPYNYTPMPAHARTESGTDIYASSSGRGGNNHPEGSSSLSPMSEVRRKGAAYHTPNPSNSTGILSASIANTQGNQTRPSQTSVRDFLTPGGSSTGRGESAVHNGSNNSVSTDTGNPTRSTRLEREAAATIASQARARDHQRALLSLPLNSESTPSTVYVRHEDSGIRMPGVVDVPPEYTTS